MGFTNDEYDDRKSTMLPYIIFRGHRPMSPLDPRWETIIYSARVTGGGVHDPSRIAGLGQYARM